MRPCEHEEDCDECPTACGYWNLPVSGVRIGHMCGACDMCETHGCDKYHAMKEER